MSNADDDNNDVKKGNTEKCEESQQTKQTKRKQRKTQQHYFQDHEQE
jgi:hypothetical protein